MTFKAYVTALMNQLTCFFSHGTVRTAISRGGQFCCSFVATLLQYLYAKNCQNIMRLDKIFLLHSVVSYYTRVIAE